MIGILDYGVGNLTSVLNGLKFFNPDHDVRIITNCYQLTECAKIVLPGVGAFKDAYTLLNEQGLDEQLVIEASKGKLILGICLGMQLLATRSFEGEETQGLNLIPGDVVKINNTNIKVPQMGWNEVRQQTDCALFKDINNLCDFYFVHSYHLQCTQPTHVLATTEYGSSITAAVWKDNIYGIQFHPEKSQKNGLILLKNFIELPDG